MLTLPKKLNYQEKKITTKLTALEIFSLLEKKYSNCFFLESIDKNFQEARYSMIGFGPYAHIRALDYKLFINSQEKKVNNPYEELQKITAKIQAKIAGKLPASFCGGLVGYLSYEATKYFEPVFKGKKNKEWFDFEFGLYLDGLLFDNKLKTVKYFYLGESRLDVISAIIDDYLVNHQNPPTPLVRGASANTRQPDEKELVGNLERPSDKGRTSPEALSTARGWGVLFDSKKNLDLKIKPLGDDIKKTAYKNLVKQAKQNIVVGEVFQLIISRQYKYKIIGDPLVFYQEVRKLNPSPHMFFMKFADRYLIGSFPELVVQLENGLIKNFPIAGTRRRGKNDQEDKKIIKELLSNEKELAEHMMLIDLGRNDLGRICQFGSIEVVKKMFIKKFSHVMHICSEIKGKLLTDKNMFDALAVSMPMGTVSGAPKVRAMDLIDKYEQEPRGPYAGSIGYFSLNGNCKFTAGLRSLFINQGIGSIRAGAGIVYDSDVEFEFQETENKLRGMKNIVESL